MTRNTVLILGAAGRLGQAAVAAFAAAGWHVLAQARHAPATPWPAGVTPLHVPLQDTGAMALHARGARVVVYAVNPPYDQWDSLMLPLARQGMDIADALQATFMLPGNVYGYGEQMPALLRPDTPQRPTNPKGRLRVQLEEEMRERAAAGGGLRAVVIRAGDFYGGGRGTWLDEAVVKSINSGKLVYPGPLDLPHAWAYLPDLARAFVAVAARAAWGEAPAFEALHFAGHTFTGRELLAAIEGAAADLGLQPARGWRHGGLPWGLIRVIGLVQPVWRELARMSYLWRVPHALDGSALQRAVGLLPATPAPLALRRTLVELGLGRRALLASAA
jgi:nucleoside-diphosphate-sugar epimerase